ncbi:hypothetical protein A2Z22_04110 [Candidatus Woesebacteria bacterium RBG_16_34_12]|uniref:HIT domain-containing protein n=1 Tax=Candidatus Woesebacteria bacterium RBG_16_34_12 TaxID=1802480 RepID=A0A1F7X801_9BACT|nr:MAG: hypothetical protein A2Z22_04110 [Candidatus Woesebacteria bacterium RBG_16_34_12]
MKDCIFCKIVSGDISSYKVYEDKDFLSFLDIRPLTKGNCLVIPKKHYSWTYDVPSFGKYFEVAKKVGLAAQKTFKSDWICFLTLGLEVPHAHIRVIPRYKNDLHEAVINLNRIENFSEKQMINFAKKISQIIN